MPRLTGLADHSKLWVGPAAVLTLTGSPRARRAAGRGLTTLAATSLIANQVGQTVEPAATPIAAAGTARAHRRAHSHLDLVSQRSRGQCGRLRERGGTRDTRAARALGHAGRPGGLLAGGDRCPLPVGRRGRFRARRHRGVDRRAAGATRGRPRSAAPTPAAGAGRTPCDRCRADPGGQSGVAQRQGARRADQGATRPARHLGDRTHRRRRRGAGDAAPGGGGRGAGGGRRRLHRGGCGRGRPGRRHSIGGLSRRHLQPFRQGARPRPRASRDPSRPQGPGDQDGRRPRQRQAVSQHRERGRLQRLRGPPPTARRFVEQSW